MRFLVLPALLAALPVTAAAQDRPQVQALTNVVLIDGTGGAPQTGMTIVITDGRIDRIFRSGDEPIPDGARVHDLTGRFVIPGLINTHVHFRQLSPGRRGERQFDRAAVLAELERSVRAGITTVREMVADVDSTAAIARLASDDAIPSPEIRYAALMAGTTFFATGAGDPADAVTSDNVGERIAQAVNAGATGVKIYSDLDPALVRRIAAEARREGLQVWAHATVFPTRPLDVVLAGAHGISHVCGLPWQVLPDVPDRFASRPAFDAARVDPHDPGFDMLFAEMARRGVVLDATLHLYRNPAVHARGCAPDLMIALLRRAHEAGVPIATGTDFFNAADEPYPSLHQEIQFLVESGVLTPTEAIVAATRNGARAIGIEATHGTIEEGKVADLVVLAANPLDDIAALRTVVSTFRAGRLYRRDSGRD